MLNRKQFKVTEDASMIRRLVGEEFDRTGGIFRLAPAWVGRPGIIKPGRRLKLYKDYYQNDIAVNERWFSSVTYSDNGVYNGICPKDHGLSYLLIGEYRMLLRDALDECGELLLGKGRRWDILPKFFDNWERIPNHMHPCARHAAEGIVAKPESYHFPIELNMDKNAQPFTAVGVDPCFSDAQLRAYVGQYFKGDNRLTDLSSTINLMPGTGYYMPPCTLHAPGSLLTYEVQCASDASCIPESRVNDMPMPPDMIDRDLPVKIARDGFGKVCEHIVSMLRCENSGNAESFRREYFRPPVEIRKEDGGSQSYVIYRTGKASQAVNPDLYSAKKAVVSSKMDFHENAAFGMIVLGGFGELVVPGKAPVNVENVALFEDTDAIGADEVFVAAEAAKNFTATCKSFGELRFYQHFSSGANPEAGRVTPPEYFAFGG